MMSKRLLVVGYETFVSETTKRSTCNIAEKCKRYIIKASLMLELLAISMTPICVLEIVG